MPTLDVCPCCAGVILQRGKGRMPQCAACSQMFWQTPCVGCGRLYWRSADWQDHHCDPADEARRGKNDHVRPFLAGRSFHDRLRDAELMSGED